MKYICLAILFCYSTISAHQDASDSTKSYSLSIETTSAKIKFDYKNDLRNRSTQLQSVSIERNELKYLIPASELEGIPLIDIKNVYLYRSADKTGPYFYIHAQFQKFDPKLYGNKKNEGHVKGGHRYVRFIFKNNKYFKRYILNGQKDRADGSSYIQYLTKFPGKPETKSFK